MKRKHFSNFKHRDCNGKIDFTNFKNRLIADETDVALLSDFGQSFTIRLEYNNYYKELSLENPSKTHWLYYDSRTKTSKTLINPYINDTVAMLAYHWRKYGNFQAYKNLEHIYDVFLQKE